MKIKINQNLAIYLDTDKGRKLQNFKQNNIYELDIVSAKYLIERRYASEVEEKQLSIREKSLNPILENKAIQKVEENKSTKKAEMEITKEQLRKKGISFHHRTGLEKLKQLLKRDK